MDHWKDTAMERVLAHNLGHIWGRNGVLNFGVAVEEEGIWRLELLRRSLESLGVGAAGYAVVGRGVLFGLLVFVCSSPPMFSIVDTQSPPEC